jgi:parvulin-like peptidyl-prolyl isomerase
MEKATKKKIKKIKNKFKSKALKITIILAVLVLLISFFSVVTWQIYNRNSQANLIEKVCKIIPYPVARVNNTFITYYDFLQTFEAAQKFYKKQSAVDISETELKKMVLEERLINNILIKEIASDYNINVSQTEINQAVETIIANKGSKQEFEEFLADFYDLNLSQYKEYFIKPNLYYKKTNQAVIDDDSLNGQAKKDIQKVLSRLRNGEDFYKLIEEYNGNANQQFKRGQLPAELEDELFNMEEGEFSDVIALAGDYQIIKLEDKNLETGNFILSFIVVETTALNDLLAEKKEKADIAIYIY